MRWCRSLFAGCFVYNMCQEAKSTSCLPTVACGVLDVFTFYGESAAFPLQKCVLKRNENLILYSGVGWWCWLRGVPARRHGGAVVVYVFRGFGGWGRGESKKKQLFSFLCRGGGCVHVRGDIFSRLGRRERKTTFWLILLTYQ